MPESTTSTAPTTPRTTTAMVPPETAPESRQASPVHKAVRTLSQLVGGAARIATSGIRQVTGRGGDRTSAAPGGTTEVELPPQDTSSEAGAKLHQTGEGILPVPHYDSLSAGDAIIAIRTLEDVAQVQAVGRHEKNNKARSTVVSAIEDRVAELSARDHRA